VCLEWPRPTATVTAMAVRRHLLVSGRVQGVAYRASCAHQAMALGVTGWAANLNDGRVEIVLEGDTAAVAHLEQWCHTGPTWAEVDHVDGCDEQPEGLPGFAVL
jgi:acylphosphatase